LEEKPRKDGAHRVGEKTTVKLRPILAMAVALQHLNWFGGDRAGEGGLLRAREPGGGVWGNLAMRHRW
jgi:hypothetical protein